jgi:catechol 2,3-dioxygenase-like lactoylglutathione lyase family enzyme
VIVKLDHIALAEPDARAAVERLTSQGYAVIFEDRRPNPVIKRRLMREWSPQHDLIMLEKAGAPPIEVLDHGHCFPEGSFLRARDGCLVAPTRDLQASTAFWHALGFRAANAAGAASDLEFRSILGSPLRLRLELDPGASGPCYLDSCGFNCLAFVATSVASEHRALQAVAVQVTDLEPITVNGRPLEIFFATGPGGELVEVLGLAKGEHQ